MVDGNVGEHLLGSNTLSLTAFAVQLVKQQNRKGTEGQLGSEPLMFFAHVASRMLTAIFLASKLQPTQQ